MSLKAIVFDYGKVLTLSPSPAHWARLAGALGVTVDELQGPYWDLRIDYDRGIYSSETYWQAVAEALGKTASAGDIAQASAWDNDQWSQINPEMLELAWRAQDAGLKIGILSNMQSHMLVHMRRTLKWLDRFHAQIYSCEIVAVKPEPKAYEIVLDALAVKAEDSIFFDDKQANIDGARAVGMHADLFEGDVATAYAAVERLGMALELRKAAD